MALVYTSFLNSGGGTALGAAAVIAAGIFPLNTSTGNQTFTLAALGGQTPKSVWFLPILSSLAAETSHGISAMSGNGFADGTSQWADYTNTYISHAQRRGLSTKCILGYDGTTEFAASFVSFGADQVTVNIDVAPGNAYNVLVFAFAGSGLSAKVNFTTGGIATGGGTAIAVGFAPDLVIGSTPNLDGDIAASTSVTWLRSLGFAKNGGNQISAASRGTIAGTGADSGVNTSNILFEKSSTGTPNYTISLGSFSGSGFTATASAAGAASDDFGFLSLKWDAPVQVYVGSFTAPTSTGSKVVTGVGFQPTHLVVMGSFDPASGDAPGDGYMVGYADATSIHSITRYGSGTAANRANAWSSASMWQQSSTSNVAASKSTLTSFDSDGFTLNYTTAAAAAWVFPFFAIKTT